VLACITGIALFITRASAHMINPAFQWKMLLMVMAALNMMMFHWQTTRYRLANMRLDNYPVILKWSGIASLLLWAGVTLAGRWVGHIV
jgi:DNA-binding transcriptional regulator of glucitol operon